MSFFEKVLPKIGCSLLFLFMMNVLILLVLFIIFRICAECESPDHAMYDAIIFIIQKPIHDISKNVREANNWQNPKTYNFGCFN